MEMQSPSGSGTLLYVSAGLRSIHGPSGQYLYSLFIAEKPSLALLEHLL